MTRSKPQEAREAIGNTKALLFALTTVLSITVGLFMYIVESSNGPLEKMSIQLEKINENLVQHVITTNSRIVALESDGENMDRRVTILESK